MTITLWTIFEILINFYQGGLETWFIYRFLTPRSHERAKIWAVIFAVCEGCLVISLYLRALEVLCTGQVCLFLRFAFLVTMQ
mgnify:CR=1 FL=1